MSAENATGSTRSDLRGLQALRALAACMVMVFHSTIVWSNHVAPLGGGRNWDNGAAGVDIFFVISGVVMALSADSTGSKRYSARQFLERRAIRVVPLYWIMTALYLLKVWVIVFFPQLENSNVHTATPLGYVLCSLFFIPYRNSVGVIAPLLAVGWTLSFEMFFYLLFAAALALRIGLLRWLTPLMIGLAAVGMFRTENWPSVTVLANSLLLEFLAGVWIGYALRSRRLTDWKPLIAIGFVSIAWILLVPAKNFGGERVLLFGVPAILLVLSTVMLERRISGLLPRWLLLMGDASYSLYLSHEFVATFVVKVLNPAGLLDVGRTSGWGELASVVGLLAPSIVAGVFVYRFVERPINDLLRRRMGLGRVQVAVAG